MFHMIDPFSVTPECIALFPLSLFHPLRGCWPLDAALAQWVYLTGTPFIPGPTTIFLEDGIRLKRCKLSGAHATNGICNYRYLAGDVSHKPQ